MPRKKAEPEVLQEETVQPEITDIEELTPAERPGLAPQIEEPVQPYVEGESSAAEELPEPSEPEKKSFYNLDFRALDQDLSPEQRQEWNTIYASFRSRSVMCGTIIGVDPHSMIVRSAQTGQTETKRMYCAVIVPFRARILIPETEMWAENDERPAFVLRNMPGSQIDFVITHVDREAGLRYRLPPSGAGVTALFLLHTATPPAGQPCAVPCAGRRPAPVSGRVLWLRCESFAA